jgi:tetratricopeptide (TPR) repeat protein
VWIDREKVLQTAQGYVAKKKYDKAVAEYQKLIQQDPDDARTLLKVGDLQSKMEAWADAVASYERVAKHYAQQGFALKAVAVYKQIREILQKHVPHLEERYGYIVPKLAELYTQLGLVSDAMSAYEEVAAKLQRGGRDREAIDVLKKIVQVDASNPLPHLRLAEAFSRLSDVAGAVRHFTTAGEILQKLGRPDDAIKVYERLLHHRPDPAVARRTAELYLARGQVNDGMLALAKLQVCFQADPRNLETLDLLGRAFITIGQSAKAFEVQKEMARLAKEQGRVDIFRRVVEHLLRVAPDDDAVRALAGLEKSRPVPPPVAARITREEDIEELDETALIDGSVPPPGQHAGPELEMVEAELLEATDAELTGEELEHHERHVVAQANSARRHGNLSRAVQVLRDGLVLAPNSTNIRLELRDLLLESGEIDGAVDEMIALASQAIDALDGETAYRHLREVLQFVPNHDRAIEMLTALGYDWSGPAQPAGADAAVDAPFQSVHPGPVEPGEEPLPAYDLDEIEEIGPARATKARDARHEPTIFPPPPAPDAGEVEEPAPVRRASAVELTPDPANLEETLEEVEFFTSRGLYEDAKAILDEQLARYPGHAALAEKLREVEAAMATGSGTRERPESASPATGAAADDGSADVFDIAAALDALDVPTADNLQPEFGSVEQQIDVEEVFAKFKEGVRAQIAETDSSTHYDLGVAYQEMGLLADAIDEFTLAARDPKRTVVCESLIAMLQRGQGRLELAIAALERALAAEMKTDEQEVGLLYELGDTCEQAGERKQALAYFQRVSRLAIGYTDPRGSVAERIAALQPSSARTQKAAPAASVEDDFDAAFDALIGGGD